MKKLQVGVIGAHRNNSEEDLRVARELGVELARRGHAVFTGACTGVGSAAAKGALNNKGLVIGVSPVARNEKHSFNGLELEAAIALVSTGMGYKGRNVVLVKSVDGVIVISGGFGTLNEVTIAEGENKPIVVIEGTGRAAGLLPQIFKELSPDYGLFAVAKNAVSAVDKLEKMVESNES